MSSLIPYPFIIFLLFWHGQLSSSLSYSPMSVMAYVRWCVCILSPYLPIFLPSIMNFDSCSSRPPLLSSVSPPSWLEPHRTNRYQFRSPPLSILRLVWSLLSLYSILSFSLTHGLVFLFSSSNLHISALFSERSSRWKGYNKPKKEGAHIHGRVCVCVMPSLFSNRWSPFYPSPLIILISSPFLVH